MSKNHIPNRTCIRCGKQFFTIKSNPKKYCSFECYAQYRREVENTKYNPSFKGVECICQKCGKIFVISQCEFAAGYGKYCSMACRRLPREEYICKLCGKKFYRLPCQVATEGYGQFCSISCRQKYTCMTAFRRKPSSIEQLLIDSLDAKNINYEFQYPFINCVLDFAFPAHKLAVEADGTYWHSLDNVKEKDKRKDKKLIENGWTILHFTEDEIHASPSVCVEKIVAHLNIQK